MKQKLLLVAVLILSVTTSAFCQISLEKIVKNSKKRTEQKIENRIENKIDNGVDNALDDIDNSMKKGGKTDKSDKAEKSDKSDKKDKKENSGDNNDDMVGGDTNDSGHSQKEAEPEKPKSPTVVWNKFDFVPGDKIIFEDGPSVSEENGEFPSRWDLLEGQVEIANVNGENVIMFIGGGPEIVPYLENADKDYLPDVFTIEFDIFRPANGNRFWVYLYDRKNQKSNAGNVDDIEINLSRVDVGGIVSEYDSGKSNDNGNWIHVSMAYTKGKFKIYLDDTRLTNIPHLEGNPSGLSIKCYWADNADNQAWFLKNVRIAEGGVKYYDRAMQDGKIVVNGIKFDVGKATLRPESMGPINEIYNLMVKQPEINFSVEGHTDSDGDDATNLKLSEERAKTVMNKLIEMGIDKSRLKSQGFGETKPINENTSAEGKAQNRRVEFVKF